MLITAQGDTAALAEDGSHRFNQEEVVNWARSNRGTTHEFSPIIWFILYLHPSFIRSFLFFTLSFECLGLPNEYISVVYIAYYISVFHLVFLSHFTLEKKKAIPFII